MSEPTDEEVEALLKEIPPQSPPGPCLDDGLLLAHREGRSGEDSDAVELHLASCAACRALLSELDQVSQPMESWALGTLRRKRRWPIGALTALAAGVILGLILIPRDELPGYELRGPLGGVRTTRSGEGESRVFVPGSIFSILLRPERRVDEPVSLLIFVEAPDGTLELLGSLAGEGGGFRYQARAQDMFGEGYGMRKVHAAIARDRIEGRITGTEEQIRRRLRSHHWMSMEIEYRASVGE